MRLINFKNKKIFIAGKNGLLGSAIYNFFLKKEPRAKILAPTSKQLDLRFLNETEKWFKKNKPDYVIIAAAKAGGILDNIKNPTIYMEDN